MSGCILIVHDDTDFRLGLGTTLAALGHRVLSAASGREALAVLEDDVPGLLVIGVGMPLMSGWKLVEALAHYPDLARIPRLLAHAGDRVEVTARHVLATLAAQARPANTPDPSARTPTPLPRRPLASA
jgi:CheY-like chemotaxis protein